MCKNKSSSIKPFENLINCVYLVGFEDYKFENEFAGVELERREVIRHLKPSPRLCLRLASKGYSHC